MITAKSHAFVYYALTPKSNLAWSAYTVKQTMSLDLDWISTADVCSTAAKQMEQRNVGALPVRDSITGKLRGILTDRDLVVRLLARWLDPKLVTVETVMTAPAIAMVYEDSNVAEAEQLMIERGVTLSTAVIACGSTRDATKCGVDTRLGHGPCGGHQDAHVQRWLSPSLFGFGKVHSSRRYCHGSRPCYSFDCAG